MSANVDPAHSSETPINPNQPFEWSGHIEKDIDPDAPEVEPLMQLTTRQQTEPPEPVSHTATVTHNGRTTELELPASIEGQTDEQTVQDLRSEISMNLIGEEEWTTLEGWTKTGENTYEITLGIHADAGGGSLDFGNRTFSVTLSPNFPPLDTTGLQTVEIDGEAHAFDLNGAEFTPEEANFLADYDWTSTSTVLPDLGDIGEEPFGLVRSALIQEFGQEQGEAAYQKLMGITEVYQGTDGVARERDIDSATYQSGRTGSVNGFSPAQAAQLPQSLFAGIATTLPTPRGEQLNKPPLDEYDHSTIEVHMEPVIDVDGSHNGQFVGYFSIETEAGERVSSIDLSPDAVNDLRESIDFGEHSEFLSIDSGGRIIVNDIAAWRSHVSEGDMAADGHEIEITFAPEGSDPVTASSKVLVVDGPEDLEVFDGVRFKQDLNVPVESWTPGTTIGEMQLRITDDDGVERWVDVSALPQSVRDELDLTITFEGTDATAFMAIDEEGEVIIIEPLDDYSKRDFSVSLSSDELTSDFDTGSQSLDILTHEIVGIGIEATKADDDGTSEGSVGTLEEGQAIESPDGQYKLLLNHDGQLVYSRIDPLGVEKDILLFDEPDIEGERRLEVRNDGSVVVMIEGQDEPAATLREGDPLANQSFLLAVDNFGLTLSNSAAPHIRLLDIPETADGFSEEFVVRTLTPGVTFIGGGVGAAQGPDDPAEVVLTEGEALLSNNGHYQLSLIENDEGQQAWAIVSNRTDVDEPPRFLGDTLAGVAESSAATGGESAITIENGVITITDESGTYTLDPDGDPSQETLVALSLEDDGSLNIIDHGAELHLAIDNTSGDDQRNLGFFSWQPLERGGEWLLHQIAKVPGLGWLAEVIEKDGPEAIKVFKGLERMAENLVGTGLKNLWNFAKDLGSSLLTAAKDEIAAIREDYQDDGVKGVLHDLYDLEQEFVGGLGSVVLDVLKDAESFVVTEIEEIIGLAIDGYNTVITLEQMSQLGPLLQSLSPEVLEEIYDLVMNGGDLSSLGGVLDDISLGFGDQNQRRDQATSTTTTTTGAGGAATGQVQPIETIDPHGGTARSSYAVDVTDFTSILKRMGIGQDGLTDMIKGLEDKKFGRTATLKTGKSTQVKFVFEPERVKDNGDTVRTFAMRYLSTQSTTLVSLPKDPAGNSVGPSTEGDVKPVIKLSLEEASSADLVFSWTGDAETGDTEFETRLRNGRGLSLVVNIAPNNLTSEQLEDEIAKAAEVGAAVMVGIAAVGSAVGHVASGTDSELGEFTNILTGAMSGLLAAAGAYSAAEGVQPDTTKKLEIGLGYSFGSSRNLTKLNDTEDPLGNKLLAFTGWLTSAVGGELLRLGAGAAVDFAAAAVAAEAGAGDIAVDATADAAAVATTDTIAVTAGADFEGVEVTQAAHDTIVDSAGSVADTVDGVEEGDDFDKTKFAFDLAQTLLTFGSTVLLDQLIIGPLSQSVEKEHNERIVEDYLANDPEERGEPPAYVDYFQSYGGASTYLADRFTLVPEVLPAFEPLSGNTPVVLANNIGNGGVRYNKTNGWSLSGADVDFFRGRSTGLTPPLKTYVADVTSTTTGQTLQIDTSKFKEENVPLGISLELGNTLLNQHRAANPDGTFSDLNVGDVTHDGKGNYSVAISFEEDGETVSEAFSFTYENVAVEDYTSTVNSVSDTTIEDFEVNVIDASPVGAQDSIIAEIMERSHPARTDPDTQWVYGEASSGPVTPVAGLEDTYSVTIYQMATKPDGSEEIIETEYQFLLEQTDDLKSTW